MLSEESLRYIAEVFNGDVNSLFSYKSGSKIVAFFNQYFNYRDEYGQGFPSRWVFTCNKLVELYNSSQIDRFFNLILSKSFLMRESHIDEVLAIENASQIVSMINTKIKTDGFLVVKKSGKFYLVNEDDDLVLIGSGGFAEVYKRKSTGYILKKLKDDFIVDKSIRSRFKREFTITESLNDIAGVIHVYDYFEDNCSYTMEEAEQTLFDYITGNSLSETSKKVCIRQVLNIMRIVHERDIIHRDLSPNNILIISGMLKISDFGLGKDLNMFNSHQTIQTNTFGQYYYCAPEQFMMLKDGDKRSDVYSLGRIINFILTEDPKNNHHFLRPVSEKATSHNAAFRYADASELLRSVERSMQFHENALNRQKRIDKAKSGLLDEEIENFIYELSGEELCNEIIASNGFKNTIIEFMKKSEEKGMYIIGVIEDNYRDVCSDWSDYDRFADISYAVLSDDYPFQIKELSARILYYVAHDVKRFSAQRLIEDLKNKGVEPLIEEILS